MPIQFIRHTGDGRRMAVWHLNEDEYVLRSMLNEELLDAHKEYIEVRNPTIRKQRLTVLVMLQRILGLKFRMAKSETGKPIMTSQDGHLSISHCPDKVMVCISPHENIGVDIERKSDRVMRIADKFLETHEIEAFPEESRAIHILIIWCAKESLYKWYSAKNLMFKENILTDPFVYSKRGELTATLILPYGKRTAKVGYEDNGTHVFTWVMDVAECD